MVVNIKFKKAFLYYVYCIITKQKYVGSSCDTEYGRWKNHKYDCYKKNKKGEYKNNGSLYKHMREFGIENFKMVVIEEWSCDNRKQLELRETFWQVHYNTVNNGLNDLYATELRVYPAELEKAKDLIEKKRIFELNKNPKNRCHYRNPELEKEYRKEYNSREETLILRRSYDKKRSGTEPRLEWRRDNYHNKNKEKILEKMKEKMKCDCGSEFRKSDKARHEKSKKHLKYLESQK